MEIYLFSNAEFDDKQTSKDAIRKVKEIAAGNHLFDLEIKRGEFGKPFFSNTREIYFNISHTYGVTAIAFSNKEIGIDVEKVGFFNEKIFVRICERNVQNNKKIEFTKEWTKYEALSKLRGDGVAYILRRIRNE